LFKYLGPVSSTSYDLSCKDFSVACKEVTLVPDKGNARGESRGEYIKLSLEKKAEIGKYASENGVAKATRHFVDLERE